MLVEREFKLLIDGRAVDGVSGFDVINPATGQSFASCPKADEHMVGQAVAAAKAAFPAWSATPIDERADLVSKLADALEARAGEFASLLTSEQGKPLDQAMFEIMGSVFTLRGFAAMRPELKVLRDEGGNRVIEHRTPLGVVAAITPWNFPVILLMNKLGPALVSGNTMVAKPAPTTPLTTLLFGEICRELLPAGVVNIVCDQNDLGAALTGHPDVAKIAFTGSTATGKKVMAAAAGAIKRVTLELGGNDAAIVLDDVDPVQVAQKVYGGAMANAGQICVAIKRAYVPESIYDAFCDELARLAKDAVVDDGDKQGTQIGPLQNAMQFEKVKLLLADAKERGTVLAGGQALDRPGYFIPPTIVRDLDDDAPLVREEQFGPVLPVLKYRDIEDVIARANNSEFGLGGTVWGKDVERAKRVAMRVEFGHRLGQPAYGDRGRYPVPGCEAVRPWRRTRPIGSARIFPAACGQRGRAGGCRMNMVERFSTRLVPMQRRQLYWSELIGETFPGMAAVVPEGISASLARWSLGRIGLAHALSQRAHLTRKGAIDRGRNFVFHFQRRGSLTMTHKDQSVTARSGDVVIADDTQSYAIDVCGQNDCLILQIPEAMLGDRFASGSWHGQMLCPDDPHVGILRRMIEGLWRERDLLDRIDQDFDGIVASTARFACSGNRPSAAQDNAPGSPLEYALRNLPDPDLGTASISEATGLSARAVQKAFMRHSGLTPTAFIAERRLQRAAELLGRADERSITDIAFEVGFNDSAFFSRCFRRRFGEAPRQWRGRTSSSTDRSEATAENAFASVQ